MNFSMTETEWVKFGKSHDFVFIGRDTVATASGIYVHFLELNTRERRIERFNDKERGDGASCLAGHPIVSMFSVAERKSNPRISIFIYPTLRRVSRCALSDKFNGYLSCSFAGTEYLVSLTSFPDFQLIVWHWKTGDQLAVFNTKIDDFVQEICCSPNPPYLISQLGFTDGKFSVYQVRTCSKIVSIHQVDVPLPGCKIVSSSWTLEENLFVCDELGDVWLVAIDINKLYAMVKLETRKPSVNRPIVVAHKDGIIIVNANSEITFYRKSSMDRKESWHSLWSILTAYHPIQMGKQHLYTDVILFHCKNGQIFKISIQHDNTPHVEIICTDEIAYKELVSITQHADHVAAIDILDRLCVFEVSTGKLIARLSLRHHGEVLRIDSHPILPLVAACSATGNSIIINLTNISLLKIINCFHLHGDLLDRMKFSYYGKLLSIGNSHNGRIFIIGKRVKEEHIDVLGLIEVNVHITDFLTYEKSDDQFKILILTTADSTVPSIGGDKIIVYTCEILTEFHTRAICIIDLTQPFKMLYHHRSNKPLGILGVPTLSKQLHQMEVQNKFQDIVLTEALMSLHQLRSIGLYVTDFRIVTYGYDGLIIIRDSMDIRRVIAVFMPHHRTQAGIKYAIATHFGETIVSLGRNGDLVTHRVIRFLADHFAFESSERNIINQVMPMEFNYANSLPEINTNRERNEVTNVHLSMEIFESDSHQLYTTTEETWLDNITVAKLKAERDEALPLRESIIVDLNKIKDQIRKLLDSNEKKPLYAQLPISAFDLDHDYRQKRIEKAQLEREELCRELEERCAECDRVALYLRDVFWHSLLVKPCILKSIDDDARIQNYSLVPSTRRTNDLKIWDKISADSNEFLYSFEVHNGSMNEQNNDKGDSVIINLDESTWAIDNDGINTVAKKLYESTDETEKLCLSGVTTHKWIADENVTLIHQLLTPRESDVEFILKKDIIIENRERKLKMHFNSLFDDMKRVKEHELKCAKECIDTLRYCASELKTIYGIDSSIELINIPNWDIEEIPEYVVTVEDHELSKKLSQSEEDGLKTLLVAPEDERESEEIYEFRTRILEKMMDGVLELKWEDKLKKDIPAPECLINKDPSKFTIRDIAIVTVYKSKVRALQKEREKYKTMLQNKMVKTKEILQNRITEFNDKLKDLERKRIQIDCAILQERLIRIRAIQKYRATANDRREIFRLNDEELASATRLTRKYIEKYNSLEIIVTELKARYDNLGKTEKRLESKFRSEFTDLKQPLVERLLRYYKKRPRADRLITTSVTYLTEVARCVANNERSDILPRDCLDFLRAVNTMDVMPGNLPSQININHWRTMCKLRRMKLETETNVKSCAVEITEAEQTLLFYQKAIQSADNIAACERINLGKMEEFLKQLTEKMEIQLVLKMGQIEIPLRGSSFDYADSILVTRQELLRVNERIVETGEQKLAAMYKSMHLRKTILEQEWQHACEKMTINVLQRKLRDIQRFKITKHVLEVLNHYPDSLNLEKDDEKKLHVNLQLFQTKLRGLLELKEARIREMKRLIAKLKRNNDKIAKEIKSKSLEIEKCRTSLNDPGRKQHEEFRKMRLAAIAKRTRLIMRLENNYEQLLSLHSQMEILRLKTYPTLKFKTS